MEWTDISITVPRRDADTAEAIATDADAAQKLFVSFGRYMSYSAIASVISEMGTTQEAQDRISAIENELGWITAIDIGDVETNPDKWYTGTLAGYPAQIEVIWDAESESIYLCLYITPTATAETK